MTIDADPAPTVTELRLPFREFSIHTRVVGREEHEGALPLLVLHGGPGLASRYLYTLDALAQGRRVIYYDQLGAGQSDRPNDLTLWSIDLFLEELSVVRRALGLDHVHLFGHAWGGMLALEHLLSAAPGVMSLVLASTTPSIPLRNREVAALVDLMPEPQRRNLQYGLATLDWQQDAVAAAVAAFDERHRLRRRAEAASLGAALDAPGTPPQVYQVMVGQNDLIVTGLLRDWDVSDRLASITAPTLVLGGRHDAVTPLLTAALHRAIPYSEYLLFEESAHFPHLEEPGRFLAALMDFLTRVEAYL